MCFVSLNEPKNVKEALFDEYWIKTVHEELEQFFRNNVWTLVPRPKSANIVGTKQIFKNKSNEFSNIKRNKAKLVAQGYTQVEGIDFDQTFSLGTILEFVWLLLTIACQIGFKLFQMDVKSAFLNGILHVEAQIEQPKKFADLHFPDHVYKLNKALYNLKQVPKALYERFTNFLIEKGYMRERVDKTLFIRHFDLGIIITQVYVDDIVFGSTSPSKVQEFFNQMRQEFEMSMVGELNFSLGQWQSNLNVGFLSHKLSMQKTRADNLCLRVVFEPTRLWHDMISMNTNMTQLTNELGI